MILSCLLLAAGFGLVTGKAGEAAANVGANFLASGAEKVLGRCTDFIKKDGNHDFYKLVLASANAALRRTLQGETKYANAAHAMAFSRLIDSGAKLIGDGELELDPDIQRCLIVGEYPEFEKAVCRRLARIQEPSLRKFTQAADERIAAAIWREFAEKLKTEQHEKGFKAFLRDALWAVHGTGAFPQQQELLERLAKGIDELPDLGPQLDEIVRKLDTIITSLTDLHRKVDQLAPHVRPEGIPSNLPPLSPNIVPRPELTRTIHDRFAVEGTVGALRGAAASASGGYGKTVAALLCAHEYQAQYPGGTFFLSMEGQFLESRLPSLGPSLGLPDGLDERETLPKVVQILANEPPALLILDNVVDDAQWAQIAGSGALPGGTCRVLVTTRSEHLANMPMIPVQRLSLPEAREVYRHFCQSRSKPDDAVADAITGLLGGLAVAVAAVGARMMLRPDVAWSDYSERLEQLPVDSLPDASEEVRRELGVTAAGGLPEHRRTLAVIDDALNALPPAERRAVEYAALLAQDQAPRSWLIELLRREPSLLAAPDPDLPTDSAAVAVDHLAKLDVLTPISGEGVSMILSLHRLWRARVLQRAEKQSRDWRQEWETLAEHAMSRRATIVGRSIDNPNVLTIKALRWELGPMASFVDSLWQVGMYARALDVGVWCAVCLLQVGDYRSAQRVLGPTWQLREILTGHSELVPGLSNLATILKDLGDLKGARQNIERAIAIDEANVASDHPTLAVHYSNLATILQDLGDLKGARQNIERAIKIDEANYASDHPTLAVRYSNLAAILRDLGDLKGARQNMERAIEIQEANFAPDHPTLAVSYSNLAAILRDLGDLQGARQNIERAIEIDEANYASDHPTLAVRYSNLAMILKDLGDLKGARQNIERAIEIEEAIYAPDHPTLAVSYSNLAAILQALGDLKGARQNIERAIEIEEANYAPDHPLLAVRYNNLAHIEFADGNRDEACRLWRLALGILRKHFDDSHPHVQFVLGSLAAAKCDECDG